ncbi:MAG: type II toxin-antitoxin system RelE/ParE family toxin [Methylobacteriaceae bacterium]|nr:type II toxin-antitoxin system RelE/ParE family toxin [Methylobacteriaceae bacterium]
MRWRLRALRELDAICEYVARENPAAAQAILRRVQESANYLTVFPQLGQATSVGGVRTKLVPGYRLFYTVLADRDEVQIIRVRDVRRRPIYTE